MNYNIKKCLMAGCMLLASLPRRLVQLGKSGYRLLLLVLHLHPAVPATPARYSRTLQGFQPEDRKSVKGDQQNQGHLIIYRTQHAAYLSFPSHLYDGCEVLSSSLCLGPERDLFCSLHRDTRHPGKYRHRQNHGKDQAGLPLRKGKDIKIIQ